jgi:hypothetical protein
MTHPIRRLVRAATLVLPRPIVGRPSAAPRLMRVAVWAWVRVMPRRPASIWSTSEERTIARAMREEKAR